MNSRDAILGRIRAALAHDVPSAAGPVAEVWPLQRPTVDQMAERFARELQAIGGEAQRCESIRHARRKLAELLEQEGCQRIGAQQCALCRELTAELPPERVAWLQADWTPTSMADLPAGLIAADYLLADTGSALIACGTAGERLLCYLPPVCIVVARTEQLAEHLPAIWEEVAGRAADPQRCGEFVIVTGPSRTADIEKILILGVHGPKRLVVLLVG